MHYENVRMALEAGKGVLCEKAFTVNRRQAAELVLLARARNLFLMEAMWTRFLPALAEVRRIIESGEIGAVRQVNADLGFKADVGPEHRLFNPALGGGALLDLGIYPLSIAVALLGPVDAVLARADLGPTGVDEQTALVLRHAGGGMSVCSCSLRARLPSELTIAGELGHVRMNTMFHRAQTVTVVRADGVARTVPTPYLGNGYVHEIVEAQRCWRAGLIESPGMTHADTLALMGVMDEARRQIGVGYTADQAATPDNA
jgi:predicted dehydrogenase